MKNIFKFFLLAILITQTACDPEVEDKIALGELPVARFDIINGATPNEFVLENRTEGAFMTQWEVAANGKFEGETVAISIPLKGEYEVTMTTFNSAGSASTSQTIVVAEDDPNSCFGNAELLTGCTEKVWKVAPEASALLVASSLEADPWWANSESDVTERSCLFNDEYIFRGDGTFEFDNKGDFWADTDGNGNVWPSDLGLDPGCQDSGLFPTQYAAWSSGNHTFVINDQTLTVAGDGAHLALYKVGTSAEVSSPQSSVTLNIFSMTENRMVLFADYGGVVWRLTFVSE